MHAQCPHLISTPLGADTFCTCGEASAHFSEVMRRIRMSPRHQAIVPGQEKSVRARTGTKGFRHSQMAVLGSRDDPLMPTRRQRCLCGVRMLVGVSNFCKNPVLQRLQKIVLQSRGLNSTATRYAWVGFTSSPRGISYFCPKLMEYSPSGYKEAAHNKKAWFLLLLTGSS